MFLKKSPIQILCSLLLTAAGSISSMAFGAAGGTSGGGGDSYSFEFVSLGYNVISSLKQDPISEINIAKLARAVTTTRVNSKDSLTLDGNLVDAINYPDSKNPRIEISRSGWNRLANEPAEKMTLVLHEYLGILKLNDQQYQISHKLSHTFDPPQSAGTHIVLKEISGTSIPWVPSKKPGPITLYAGTAGTIPPDAVLNPNSTLDTCKNPASKTPGLYACNDARIHPALQLKVRFKSKVAAGTTLMTINSRFGSSVVPGFIPVTAAPNFLTEVSVAWGNICSAMLSVGVTSIDANCLPTGTPATATFVTLNVGVSVDGSTFTGGDAIPITVIIGGGIGQDIGSTDISTTSTCENTNGSPVGLCQFSVTPGNGKVFLRDLILGSDQSPSGRPFRKARLLWVEGDGSANHSLFGTISSASPHKDLDFGSGGGSLSSDFVKGFKNDTAYTFKIAVVDEVGNVGYYSDSIPSSGETMSNDEDCSTVTAQQLPYQCHVATPSRTAH
jgi:hypothetical protein